MLLCSLRRRHRQAAPSQKADRYRRNFNHCQCSSSSRLQAAHRPRTESAALSVGEMLASAFLPLNQPQNTLSTQSGATTSLAPSLQATMEHIPSPARISRPGVFQGPESFESSQENTNRGCVRETRIGNWRTPTQYAQSHQP